MDEGQIRRAIRKLEEAAQILQDEGLHLDAERLEEVIENLELQVEEPEPEVILAEESD